jgi:hypothetical protein
LGQGPMKGLARLVKALQRLLFLGRGPRAEVHGGRATPPDTARNRVPLAATTLPSFGPYLALTHFFVLGESNLEQSEFLSGGRTLLDRSSI